MELTALLASFLTPFLPHLLKLGTPVAEEAGKTLGSKLGEGTWETAKQVWGKLSPKVAEKPLAQGALEALADNSQDNEAQEVWISQLTKMLAANSNLAEELQRLLDKDAKVVKQAVSVSQTVVGDRNIVIGNSSGFFNLTQSQVVR
ncbi:hypothetical protein IQ260_10985 [Leptolyngbya cf. ectocarpi LEGE 11479]|uniref:Uncharacterized protein n=1 Tax=Leptolyngbya cf. ectocarpi LEGE 11479 TaxID=1828722 RepID=A0A928ZRC0_LEPEC|nr:hypothetical protein [Leptolyngbya ectocarpi]MBE9067180.1 hypothetical protein [Leptolyngbya cf. ectocarpi LEGE 11479]